MKRDGLGMMRGGFCKGGFLSQSILKIDFGERLSNYLFAPSLLHAVFLIDRSYISDGLFRPLGLN